MSVSNKEHVLGLSIRSCKLIKPPLLMIFRKHANFNNLNYYFLQITFLVSFYMAETLFIFLRKSTSTDYNIQSIP
jgi:hypothetical protein